MALRLAHATPQQVLSAFREKYAASKGADTARLARWMAERLAAGDFTALEVRTAFGMNVGQFTAMQARLNVLKGHLEAIEQAIGE